MVFVERVSVEVGKRKTFFCDGSLCSRVIVANCTVDCRHKRHHEPHQTRSGLTGSREVGWKQTHKTRLEKTLNGQGDRGGWAAAGWGGSESSCFPCYPLGGHCSPVPLEGRVVHLRREVLTSFWFFGIDVSFCKTSSSAPDSVVA